MAEPTPAEKLLELRRKRNEALAAEYAARPSPPPPAPTEDFQSTASMPARMTEPGLADTTTKYRDALMNAAESQRGVGPEAVALANEADTLSPDVRSIPPAPGYADQLARSFLPQLVEQDDRPASGWDRLRGAASLPISLSELPVSHITTFGQQVQGLTNRLPESSLIRRGVDALVPDESIAQSLTGVSRESGFDALAKMGEGIEAVGDSGVGFAGPADLVGLKGVGDLHRAGVSTALGSLGATMQVPKKFQPGSTVPNDLRGLPAENGIMYLLRVLGSTAEAGAIETAERTPVNIPQAMVGGAAQKALDATGIKPPTLFEKVVHELEPVTFGEIIGAPPGHAQKVDRESPMGDWFQGFLERVERGEGAEVDGATIATNLFGPEYANAGYVGGLLMSFLVDWEGAAGRLPAKMADIGRTARAMGELNGASLIDNLAPALSSTVVDVAPTIGRQLAADVEAGRKTIDELGPLRPFLVDVAAAEGRTIEEVATEDGLRKLDLSDPEQLAREKQPAIGGPTSSMYTAAQPADGWGLEREGTLGGSVEKRAPTGDTGPAAPMMGSWRAELSDLERRANEQSTEVLPVSKDVMLRSPKYGAANEQKFWLNEGKEPPSTWVKSKMADTVDVETPAALTAGEWSRLSELRQRAVNEDAVAKLRTGPGDATGATPREFYDNRDAIKRLEEQRRLGDEANEPGDFMGPLDAGFGDVEAAALRRARGGGEPPAPAPVKGKRAQVIGPDQAPGNQYVIRNERRDVVPNGVHTSLADAVAHMRKRSGGGVQGDVLWRSGQRPIGTWAEVVVERFDDNDQKLAEGTGEFKLVPTRGADGADLAWFEENMRNQPTARPRPFPKGGGDVAGKVLLEAATGRKMPTTPPMTATGRMVEQAVALWARDKLGSDQLVFLPTGALVSHADRSRILGAVQRDLELVGLGARGDQDLAMLSGKKPMTPEQRGAVAGLAREYGLDPRADYSQPDAFLSLQKAAVRHHGGVLADAKSRVRGVPAFAQRLRTTLATLHTDRRAWSGFAKTARQLPFVQAFTSKFFDDALAALPPEPRAALQEGRSQMERVGDDLVPSAKAALDAKRVERGLKPWEVMTDDDVAAALSTLFANARWALHPTQLDRVAAIEGALLDGSVLKLAEDPSVRGLLPSYARTSNDPVLVAAGLQQYAKDIRSIQRDAGQDYIRMLLMTAGHSVKAEGDLAKNVTHLTEESLRQVYNEVVVKGDFMGPTTTRLMASLTTGKPKPDQAILAFMAQQRQKEIITRTFDRLVSTGAVLKLDERFVRSAQAGTDVPHVLTRLLNGTAHRTLENGARVYDTPPGATAWAERLLWSMGLEPGSGAKLNQVALSDTRRFLLPEQTQNAVIQALTGGRIRSVEDAVAEGLAKPDALEEGVMEAYRLWKEFATTGVILPRPSYFLGQALGQLQTLGMNRSLGDLAKTAPHVLAQGLPMIKKPGMVGELITRLKDPDLHPRFAPFSPANEFLRSADGTLHSLDQLEDGLRGNGLADSIVAYETAPQMQRVIAENNTLLGRVLLPAREWQRHVRDFAGGFDQAARVSIFLQEVERGVPYAEAARTAKATALDFRALTPFEANVMRKTFTFYAYLRKSTDALAWALLNHPGRVTRQMRLAHWSFARDKTAEEIGAASNREPGRLRPGKLWNNVKDLFGGGAPGADSAWRGDFFDKSGRANPRYTWSMQTAPIGISDYILLQGMIDPMGALTDSLNPMLDMSAILLMRRKVGREFDTDRANTVPSWMIDAPDGNILAQYLGVGPVELDPERDDPAEASVSATQANNGRPSKWAAGASVEAVASNDQGRYRDRWQQMSLLLGNGTRNVENWARVGVPRPGATSWEELAFLLGTPLGKELSRDEAVYQSTERLRRPMEEATRGLQGLATPPE